MAALFLDGDSWCIAEDGFTNLQESECEFVPVDSLTGKLLTQVYDLLTNDLVGGVSVKVRMGVSDDKRYANYTYRN